MSTILFSGRFDRPHIGHIATLARLGKEFDEVIVVVLDYPEQFYPIEDRMTILKLVLDSLKGNYRVIANRIHFATISRSELSALPHFDVYGSGNEKCLEHISMLEIENVYVPRTPGYAASDDIKYHKIINFIEKLLNE